MGGGKLTYCALAIAVTAAPGLAAAQGNDPAAFTGAYAGPELGAHEQHVFLEETNVATGATRGRYYRAWGVGGGAFAGYEWPIARRVRIGLEASLSVGGASPVARFADGTSYAQHPLWGLRGTGRAGYLLTDRLLAYGTFGYGTHHYRLENGAGVTDVHTWAGSFTIGAGFEYRLSRRIGVRLDFRHLDNSMSHVLVGLPIRF